MTKPKPKGGDWLTCAECGADLLLVDGFAVCSGCNRRLIGLKRSQYEALERKGREIVVSRPKDWKF